MSEVIASAPVGRPLWVKLIITVLLTVGVGPLVGTILVYLADAAGLTPMAISIYMQGQTKLSVLVSGYVSGGLQAFICGLVFALVGWLSGRLPIWVPIVIALALAALFALALFGVSGNGIVFSVIIHIVPALVTWWLVKAYWQKAVT
jgi:tetrahydromethanopterin S-methyltransferase subunit F